MAADSGNSPSISIITPSLNQGRYIEATIRSVLAQNYPDFEHIIIDGGSTDDTAEILKRYPHLRIICEKDRGQSDAVNKGLRAARGEIIGWLNSDDTYYPEIFATVASSIDPARGVLMVMGRCAYIDETGSPTGREHPSAFTSHSRVVEIWKGYTLPQPAIFFHRSVYEKCGGMDEELYFALDYELFLRYTRCFRIHTVNRLFATYRIHVASKTTEISQGELLERSLLVSRRYWGEPSTLSYWRYLASYWLYGGSLGTASIKRLNRAESAYLQGRVPAFLGNLLLSLLLFPVTPVRYLVLPRLRAKRF